MKNVTIRKENPTCNLRWDNGILMQEWEIYEKYDAYTSLSINRKYYSHSGDSYTKEWREIPKKPLDT